MSVELHYNSFDGVLVIVISVVALGGENIVNPLTSLGEEDLLVNASGKESLEPARPSTALFPLMSK